MQTTTNYSLLIPEGTDIVNPLTQVNPNFQTIDGAMFANKQASIGTASEVVTGTVHAINRNNTDSDVFRFTATGAWTSGDTMTLDGQSVNVHLSDGTTPASGAYIIGAEVVAVVNGTLVTLLTSAAQPVAGVTSFNSRTGAVVPASSDYDGSMIDYDNTVSGLNSTDVQGAIDEIATSIPDNYSTTEHVVGTWIDGSPLYEKTIDLGYLPNATIKNVPHGISNLDVVVSLSGIANTTTVSVVLPSASPAGLSNAVVIVRNDANIVINSGMDYSAYHGYATIRYTKTV